MASSLGMSRVARLLLLLRAAHALSVDSLASRAADAMRHGRAHVEADFLSGGALDAARADMSRVLAQIGDEADGSFSSIQTDLLNPEFRRQLVQQQDVPFADVLERLEALRLALAHATARPLLDGGGLHLMRYPPGAKFMRHVDEDAALYEPVRNSVSFLLYLTPSDWAAADGGALYLYEASSRREVMPVSGSLVLYDSAMEHEVLPTRRVRELLSGRFRERDEDWQRGRPAET